MNEMTLEVLDSYLESRDLLLDFIYEHDNFHWTVSRSDDGVIIVEGVDPDEATMIDHVLSAPLDDTVVLKDQPSLDFV
jgi:hypothetical protein